MRLAFIDDNKTVLMVNEIMLKKEKIIKNEDTVVKHSQINEFSEADYIDFANDFDFVACDFNLGKDSINGLEFLKKIKNTNSEITCVLLTGDDSLAMKTKMMLHANINYVIKNNEKNGNSTLSQLGELINHCRNNIKINLHTKQETQKK